MTFKDESKRNWNPCVSCGACCAYFRVHFYWREANDQTPHGVPLQLTEDTDDFRRSMKGTNEKSFRGCCALKGRVGKSVSCSIYPNRPSPCRAFQPSYQDDKQNKRCDEARKAHGLKPIQLSDWYSPDRSTMVIE